MTSQHNNNNNNKNNNQTHGNPPNLSASHPDLSMAMQNVMMALYKFEAEADPEISLSQYEHIEILDMDPALNGWAYARRKRDGKAGYVPISYLGALQSNVNRPHKHPKSGINNQTRSTSPNPNKSRYDDKNSNNLYNARANNYKQNKKHYNEEQNDANSVTSSHTAHSQQHQSQQAHHSNKGNHHNNNNNNNNNSNNDDPRQLICSFHRDFIPDLEDLYAYFGKFGKVTNKIEVEYDQRRVPMAKIRFQSPQSVQQVCEKGNRQQIPSSNQNGNIYIRVYRSTQEYHNSLQQQSRPYKSSRRGGGHQSSRRGGY